VRNIWGKYNTEQPVEKVREARGIFDQHGIKVSVVDTAFFRIPLPPESAEGRRILDAQWALLNTSMERGKAFGTQTLRIFAFMASGAGAPSEKSYARMWELLSEAARRARPGGFKLAVENLGAGSVATGAQSAEMLKGVKADNFGLLWDPNNAGEAGEQAFPDGYRKLDPARIFHVHLRDYKHQAGKVVWAAVGDGEFDNLGQIRALLKDGYKQAFTLETHWRDPKGKAYSSATSLKGLLKVIERV
jgi:sugar phosphate isomerase/epimerase